MTNLRQVVVATTVTSYLHNRLHPPHHLERRLVADTCGCSLLGLTLASHDNLDPCCWRGLRVNAKIDSGLWQKLVAVGNRNYYLNCRD